MGQAGKSVENIQNIVLGQFESAKRQTPSMFINDEIARAKKAKEKFEKTKSNLTNEQKYEIAKKRIQEQQEQANTYLQQIADDTSNHHVVLKNFYQLFDRNINFDREYCEQFLDENDKLKEHEIYSYTTVHNNEVKITIIGAKCTKKHLQVKLHIEYEKRIFVKAEDFETTKNVDELYVVRELDAKLKIEYGNIIKFRQSCSSQFNELLQLCNIKDDIKQTKIETTTSNSWTFDEI